MNWGGVFRIPKAAGVEGKGNRVRRDGFKRYNQIAGVLGEVWERWGSSVGRVHYQVIGSVGRTSRSPGFSGTTT